MPLERQSWYHYKIPFHPRTLYSFMPVSKPTMTLSRAPLFHFHTFPCPLRNGRGTLISFISSFFHFSFLLWFLLFIFHFFNFHFFLFLSYFFLLIFRLLSFLLFLFSVIFSWFSFFCRFLFHLTFFFSFIFHISFVLSFPSLSFVGVSFLLSDPSTSLTYFQRGKKEDQLVSHESPFLFMLYRRIVEFGYRLSKLDYRVFQNWVIVFQNWVIVTLSKLGYRESFKIGFSLRVFPCSHHTEEGSDYHRRQKLL